MDKHEKTITIKINGKERQIITDKNNRHGEGSQFFDGSSEEAINETAAAQETIEESFDWILPEPIEEEAVKEYKIASIQPAKRKKNIDISVWNKKPPRKDRTYTTIFLTVFFAVLLGIAFGVTILKFVTADSEKLAPVSSTARTVPATDKPNPGSESVQLDTIPAIVVQNGIFTSEEAAKERVNLLGGQGIKAEIFPGNGQFAVYLGIADSMEEAKQNAEELKSKGVEVFAKTVDISGGTAAGLTGEEAEFLKQAPDIYTILSAGAAVGPEPLKKIEDYQTTIQKIADKNIKDKNVLKAKAGIERACGIFIGYQTSKDANQLAEMQTVLLAFLSAYQSIGK